MKLLLLTARCTKGSIPLTRCFLISSIHLEEITTLSNDGGKLLLNANVENVPLISLNCIYWINGIHTYMYIFINIDCFIIYMRIRKQD